LQLQFPQKANGYIVSVKTCETSLLTSIDIVLNFHFELIIFVISGFISNFIFCRNMYCFSYQSGKLEHLMKVCTSSRSFHCIVFSCSELSCIIVLPE
jgi:hypothetical protein